MDLLLDVAASGENVVEREGLSVRHPARFVLIGSGNPEEGELRPQLLDRFGLSVEVKTPTELADRVEVVKRRDGFDRDPQAFVARWAGAEAEVRARIEAARARLPKIRDVRRGAGGRIAPVHGHRRGRPARRADPAARRPRDGGAGRRGGGVGARSA